MTSTIITKNSSTATSVPATGSLTQGELAVNVTDKRLFTKDSGGTVVEVGTNPSSLTLPNGTANGLAYLNGSKVLTSGSALTFDGTNFATSGTSSGSRIIATSTLADGSTPHLDTSASAFGIVGGSSSMGYKATSQHIWNLSGTSEQMRLTSTGLGIGTSSPSYPLDVVGSSMRVRDSGNINYVSCAIYGGITLGGNGAGTRTVQTASTDALTFGTNSTERMRLDSSGNLALGATSANQRLEVVSSVSPFARFRSTASAFTGVDFGQNSAGAGIIDVRDNQPLILYTNDTERARIDSSGNLLVGTTSNNGSTPIAYFNSTGGSSDGVWVANTNAAAATIVAWNKATSGNNSFQAFLTEGTTTTRGSISYNRAGGLVAYNTTSDYRAKDISGPVTGSGELIDSTPVYMGKMKGATQERPMFIAHETPSYAHTGEKDAVDKDGNPVYQQMDASALIPVMWAEIQSLRKRLADAGL